MTMAAGKSAGRAARRSPTAFTPPADAATATTLKPGGMGGASASLPSSRSSVGDGLAMGILVCGEPALHRPIVHLVGPRRQDLLGNTEFFEVFATAVIAFFT